MQTNLPAAAEQAVDSATNIRPVSAHRQMPRLQSSCVIGIFFLGAYCPNSWHRSVPHPVLFCHNRLTGCQKWGRTVHPVPLPAPELPEPYAPALNAQRALNPRVPLGFNFIGRNSLVPEDAEQLQVLLELLYTSHQTPVEDACPPTKSFPSCFFFFVLRLNTLCTKMKY